MRVMGSAIDSFYHQAVASHADSVSRTGSS
jgi:hypothetical protein